MIAPERVALVLLAAGASRRFGAEDKLLAPLHGRPVVDHAAQMLRTLPFGANIAVCAYHAETVRAALGAHGYAIASGPRSDEGMAGSLGIGVAEAQLCNVDAVLLCLADMPFVPEAHVRALLASYDGGVVASVDEQGVRMPPVLLPRMWFAELQMLSGDTGARTLLSQAHVVTAPPGALRDIDRPRDLVD